MSNLSELITLSDNINSKDARKAIKNSKEISLPKLEAIDLNLNNPDIVKNNTDNEKNTNFINALQNNSGLRNLSQKNSAYSSIIRENPESFVKISNALTPFTEDEIENRRKQILNNIGYKSDNWIDFFTEGVGDIPETAVSSFHQYNLAKAERQYGDKLISKEELESKKESFEKNKFNSKENLASILTQSAVFLEEALRPDIDKLKGYDPILGNPFLSKMINKEEYEKALNDPERVRKHALSQTYNIVSMNIGLTYQDITNLEKELGYKLNSDTKFKLAQYAGKTNTLLQLVGGGILGKLTKSVISKVIGKTSKEVLKEILIASGTEFTQEALEATVSTLAVESARQTIQTLNPNMSEEKKKTFVEGMKNQVPNIIKQGTYGAIAGGSIVGISGGVAKIIKTTGSVTGISNTPKEQINKLKKQKDKILNKNYNTTKEKVNASVKVINIEDKIAELENKMPESTQLMVKQAKSEITNEKLDSIIEEVNNPNVNNESLSIIAQDNEETLNELFIDPNDIDTLFQTKNTQYEWETAQDMIEDLNLQEEYEDAKSKGEKLNIPVDRFVEKIATSSIAQDIKQHTTFSRDEDSLFEVKEEEKRLKKIDKDINKKYKEIRNVISEKFEPALETRGYAEVESNVDLLSHFLYSISERTKINPDEIIEELNLTPINVETNLKKKNNNILGTYKYSDGKSIISLFDNANISTLAHETSHMYLDFMTRLESKTTNEQFIKDMEIIREYVNNDGNSWTKSQHEMFAESWTTYLKEGKAPTPELKTVFVNFARWLSLLYKRITQIKVPINDEIRGVFDRMLATNEQIKEANSYKNIDDYKGEALFNDLDKHWEQAENKAFGQLFDKAMRNERKKMRIDWKETKDKLKNQAKKEIEESKIGKVLKSNINIELFKASYGKDEFKKVKKHRAFVNNANADSIEIIAKENGYEVANLISELEESLTLNQLIKNRENELIAQATRSEVTDADIEKAVLNIQTELPLQTELNILNTKLGEKQLNVSQIIKANAIKDAKQVNVKDINSYRHLISMRSASTRSKQYLRKNNLLQAKEEKIKEMYHFYMSREHLKAREFITKARNYLTNFDVTNKGKPKSKFIAMEKAMAISDEYNPAELLRKLRNFETIGLSKNTIDELEQFIENNKEYNLIIPNVLTQPKVETYGDLKDLYDFMKQIENIGRKKNKIAEGKKLVNLFDKAKEMVAQARKDKPVYVKRDIKKQSLNAMEKTQSIFESIVRGGFIKLSELTRTIDGKEKGMFYNEFYTKLRDSEVKNNSLMSEYNNKIFKLMQSKKINMNENVVVKLSNGINKTYTKETILSWVLNMGNEGNLERLITGNLKQNIWSDSKDADIILNLLSKNEMDFVQGIWNILEELGDLSMQNNYKITGIKVERVQAQPVVTKHGIYDGGYYPIKYDPASVSNEFKEITSIDLVDEMFSSGNAYTTTSHLKNRTATAGKALNSDISVLDNHIRTVILDIAFRENFINIQKLKGTSAIKKKIIGTVGKKGMQYIDNIMVDVINGKIGGRTSAVTTSLNYLHSAGTLAIFGLNIKTGISAFVGFIPALGEVRFDLMVKGLAKGLIFDYKKMTEKSAFMRNRVHPDIIKDLSSVKNFDNSVKAKLNRADSKFSETMFLPMRIGDLMASGSVWWGAYYQFQKNNSNLDPEIQETKAIQYADSIVADTQGSYLMLDKSIIQRDKRAKYFLFAYTIFNVFANHIIRNSRRLRSKNTKKMAHAVASTFVAIVGSSVVEQTVRGFFPEDSEKIPEWVFAETLRTLASTIPVIGKDIGEFLVRTMVDDEDTSLSEFGGRFSGNLAPLFNISKNTIRGLNILLDMAENNLEFDDLSISQQKTLTNVLVLFKMPIVQIKRSLNAFDEADSNGDFTDIIQKGLGYKK